MSPCAGVGTFVPVKRRDVRGLFWTFSRASTSGWSAFSILTASLGMDMWTSTTPRGGAIALLRTLSRR